MLCYSSSTHSKFQIPPFCSRKLEPELTRVQRSRHTHKKTFTVSGSIDWIISSHTILTIILKSSDSLIYVWTAEMAASPHAVTMYEATRGNAQWHVCYVNRCLQIESQNSKHIHDTGKVDKPKVTQMKRSVYHGSLPVVVEKGEVKGQQGKSGWSQWLASHDR